MVDGQSISLLSIYEDREGVLWLGRQASGVGRFSGTTLEDYRS